MKKTANKSNMSIKSVKRIVDQEIRKQQETKFYDASSLGSYTSVGSAQTGSASNQYLGCITANAAGTGVQNRVGNEIRISSINLRFDLANDSTLTSYPSIFRIMVIQWHPASVLTSSPSTASFLSAATNATFNYNAPLLPMPQANQFTVLYDTMVSVAPTGNPGCTKAFTVYITKFPKFATRNITFVGTGVNDATNHIFVYAVSDSAAAGAYPKMSFWSRIRYTDS